MGKAIFLLTPYLSGAVLICLLRLILPGRGRDRLIPLLLVPLLLTHIPALLWGSASAAAQISALLAGLAMCIGYPLLLLGGERRRRIAGALFLLLLRAAAELLCRRYLFGQLGLSAAAPETYPPAQLLGCAAVRLTLFTLLGSCGVLVLRSVSRRSFDPWSLVFLVFPLSQLLQLNYCLSDSGSALWLLWGMLLGLGAELALLGYTISYETKAALEQELLDTRHTMSLEQLHYAAVEAQQEKLAQLRTGCSAQLLTVAQMLDTGADSGAQQLLGALAEGLQQTKEAVYCPIPVVNAVLAEKQRACQAAGVDLELHLALPPDIPVEPLHLCSIFGNLLDNALHGALDSGVSAPTVRLTAAQEGGYLFIKTVNPAGAQLHQPAPGHGYGLRILQSLAQQYGGAYVPLLEDGVYTAIVTLLC